MYQRRNVFLNVFMKAIISAACGPTDAGIGTNLKMNLTANEMNVYVAPRTVGR